MSFAGVLRQATAVDVLIGPFVDSTDGDTEEAALTINRADVLLSKNGQGAVQKTDVTAAASDADGFYNCELDATDTGTVGQLTLYVHVAGALAVRHDYQVVEEVAYDLFYASGATPEVTTAAAVWDRVLTGATHNVPTSAGRRLRGIQEFQGYEGGAVWIDTVNGATGTTDFEFGTVEQPVKTIGEANTIAASLNLTRFHVDSGSSITLEADQKNQFFDGENWTLALGGQNIDGSFFSGASVSGIATNDTGEQVFSHCTMGAVTLPADTHVLECGISGTQTIGEAGDFAYDRCHSDIAGTSTPSFDFGSGLAASNVSFRNYSGGIEIKNMGAGAGSYQMSLEGRGQLIINANCSATSAVAIRGLFTVTDNASGAVTLSDDARYDVAQVNAEVDTALSDFAGPTKAEMDTAHALLATPAQVLTQINAALDTILSDSIPADGTRPSLRQAAYMNTQFLVERSVSGNTVTVKKPDGSTLFTLTLDDAVTPTSITRTT